jgi:hypothetical protein
MKMKDVGFRIRIDRELRDAFIEACRAQDRPAAQVLREFMRGYISERSGAAGFRPSQRQSRKTRLS